MTFDSAPDLAAVDNATYIEAINYFCDMETGKQLEVLRDKTEAKSDALHKNTVLVLPKLPG